MKEIEKSFEPKAAATPSNPLESDVSFVVNNAKNFKTVSKVKWEKKSKTLEFQVGQTKYTAQLVDSYPKETVLMSDKGVEIMNVPLKDILEKLDRAAQAAPSKKSKKLEDSFSSDDGGASIASDEDGDGDDDLAVSGSDLAAFAVTPLCKPFERDIKAVNSRFGKDIHGKESGVAHQV